MPLNSWVEPANAIRSSRLDQLKSKIRFGGSWVSCCSSSPLSIPVLYSWCCSLPPWSLENATHLESLDMLAHDTRSFPCETCFKSPSRTGIEKSWYEPVLLDKTSAVWPSLETSSSSRSGISKTCFTCSNLAGRTRELDNSKLDVYGIIRIYRDPEVPPLLVGHSGTTLGALATNQGVSGSLEFLYRVGST